MEVIDEKIIDDFIQDAEKANTACIRNNRNYTGEYYEYEANRKSQLEKLEAANKGIDLDLKIQYGYCVLWVLIGWCVFVVVICCIHMDENYVKLSDSVLITLFSTTTINIIGLPLVVLNYLFRKE